MTAIAAASPSEADGKFAEGRDGGDIGMRVGPVDGFGGKNGARADDVVDRGGEVDVGDEGALHPALHAATERMNHDRDGNHHGHGGGEGRDW